MCGIAGILAHRAEDRPDPMIVRRFAAAMVEADSRDAAAKPVFDDYAQLSRGLRVSSSTFSLLR